jgi:hypothetical protein
VALLYWSRSSETIAQRLGELTGSSFKAPSLDPGYEKVVVQTLKRLGDIAPKMTGEMSKLQQRLLAAGYRRPEALLIFSGIRVAAALVFFVVFATPVTGDPSLGTAMVACLIG